MTPWKDQSINYTLTVSNNSAAAAVPAGQTVIISFSAPTSFNITSARGGSDWLISLVPCPGKFPPHAGHGPVLLRHQLMASYVGAYPINPGQTLQSIIVSGRAMQVSPAASSVATVSTPDDSNLSDNTVSITQQIIEPTTATLWVQTLTTCGQPVPGVMLELKGSGLDLVKASLGEKREAQITQKRPCPLQQHTDCLKTSTGCLAWSLPVPAHGTTIYTIKEKPESGSIHCPQHIHCAYRPEFIKVSVDANGTISASTTVFKAAGGLATIPRGKVFTGQQSDPAPFYYQPSPGTLRFNAGTLLA
ncbi:MAG TPA: hypothetical protein VKR06_31915 [Ktedonosporobacter sp.]|nr:hypothetical protein [Ktedonosporobacter sp.]